MSVAGAPVAADAALVRHVTGRQQQDGVVSGSAFRPRPTEGGALSVNVRGVLAQEAGADLTALQNIIGAWLTVRASGRLAEFIAADAIATLAAFGLDGKVTFDPRAEPGKPDDQSHALLQPVPDGDDENAAMVRDLLALQVTSLHLAVP